MDIQPIKLASIYFAFCISVPSTLLYTYLCIVIVVRPQFHTTFFALFLVRFVADQLYLLDSVFSYRFPALGLWLPLFRALPPRVLTLFYFLSNYTQHADNLATVLLLLNRFTAIAFPLHQIKIWRHLLPVSVALVFLLPLPFTWFIFGMRLQIVLDTESGSGAFSIQEQLDPQTGETLIPAMAAQSALSALLFLLTSVAINTAILVAYKQRMGAAGIAGGQTADREEAIEKKLLVYALATFGGHFLCAVLTLLIFLIASMPPTQQIDVGWLLQLCYTQYPWVFDCGCIGVPAWLLLWASTQMRAQLRADSRKLVFALLPIIDWRKWRKKTTPTAAVVVFQQPQTSSRSAAGSHNQQPRGPIPVETTPPPGPS